MKLEKLLLIFVICLKMKIKDKENIASVIKSNLFIADKLKDKINFVEKKFLLRKISFDLEWDLFNMSKEIENEVDIVRNNILNAIRTNLK